MFWKMNSVSELKRLMLILLKGVEQSKTLVLRCTTYRTSLTNNSDFGYRLSFSYLF